MGNQWFGSHWNKIKLKIPEFGCIFLSLKNETNIVSYGGQYPFM